MFVVELRIDFRNPHHYMFLKIEVYQHVCSRPSSQPWSHQPFPPITMLERMSTVDVLPVIRQFIETVLSILARLCAIVRMRKTIVGLRKGHFTESVLLSRLRQHVEPMTRPSFVTAERQ